MSRINIETGCWDWQARLGHNGYGLIHVDGGSQAAHRASYRAFVGPIPGDLTIDHLCFNPACVNPEHLRLLTRSENSRNRRNVYRTHCKHGHEFTPENTRWHNESDRGGRLRRRCRACHQAKTRRQRERRKAVVA